MAVGSCCRLSGGETSRGDKEQNDSSHCSLVALDCIGI